MAKIAPAILISLLLVGGMWRLQYWATMLGNNTREVQEIDVAIGNWLAENSLPDSLIAVDDIGAIAFISGRRIVDMHGLVSPEVWPATGTAEGLPRNQVLTRILAESQPDFMAGFPLWHWDIANNAAVANAVHQVQTDTHTIIFQPEAAVYEMTWPYVTEAMPEHLVTVTFGDGIRLLGYDSVDGNPLELVFYWESQAEVNDSYDVFVHLLNEKGEIVAQLDGKPLDGLVATDIWQVGEIIRDPRLIALPDDIPAGSYEVLMGVYLRESGERLLVKDGTSSDEALMLEPVQIP